MHGDYYYSDNGKQLDLIDWVFTSSECPVDYIEEFGILGDEFYVASETELVVINSNYESLASASLSDIRGSNSYFNQSNNGYVIFAANNDITTVYEWSNRVESTTDEGDSSDTSDGNTTSNTSNEQETPYYLSLFSLPVLAMRKKKQ